MNDIRVVKSPDFASNRFYKETEEHSVNSGSHFSLAIENADGVPYHLIYGPEIGEGYYLNVGEGIKQLLGIESHDFTEKLFHAMIEEIVPLSDDIPADLSGSRKKLINGEILRYKAEILLRLPDGKRKWIRDSSLPVYDDETGRVIGSFGILFDISDHKQTSGLANTVNESDRLKTAFLQNISHEIRTPLNAIVGFSTLLCEPGYNQDNRQEYLNIINNNTDQLLEVLDHIVEISRIEANAIKITRKEVNLNSLCSGIYQNFRAKASEKGIFLHYETNIGNEETIVMTDGYKLNQVLTNLVSNAIKFTIDGKVNFGFSVKDNMIEFHVCDTGIGIPEEHQPKIFSRFFQAEDSSTRCYEGTGLGLAISKAYIELLGGTIRFTSQPGTGSVFTFTLPFTK